MIRESFLYCARMRECRRFSGVCVCVCGKEGGVGYVIWWEAEVGECWEGGGWVG